VREVGTGLRARLVELETTTSRWLGRKPPVQRGLEPRTEPGSPEPRSTEPAAPREVEQ
jgi:hypothetical protein